VEHLLEMGDEPEVVGGVARYAAAQMIVDPTLANVAQGGNDGDSEGGVTMLPRHGPQKAEERRLRKFGSTFEPPVMGVSGAEEGPGGRAEQRWREFCGGRRGSGLGPQGAGEGRAVG